MRTFWALPAVIFLGCFSMAAADPRVEPVLQSLHPFTVQRGTTSFATVRGTGLTGAKAAFPVNPAISISTESVQAEAPSENSGRRRAPMDLVRVRIQVTADAKPGRHSFRLITANGVSNSLPLHVMEVPVTAEPEGQHQSPESAVPIPAGGPTVFTGRISRRGEADYYSFHAEAGQALTFVVISGLPQVAAAGSAATIANFDPALTIYEGAGSWFDAKRLNRIAFNDEPVFVFGKPTDVHLSHKFQRTGTHWIRVEAFAGQGGPDYGYQLKVLPGEIPVDPTPPGGGWDERGFTRTLTSNRLNQLAARGGSKQDLSSIETYRAAPMLPAEAPLFKLPGTLEGTLAEPGETHRARFQLDGPRDIAIEVETPATAAPFFNPIVRLLNAGGEEVATNIFAGRGACNGNMNKSFQSKAIIPMRESGTYTIEVRDAIVEAAGPDFRYRVQVRQQVPHIGKVTVDTDHINLAPGEAKTIRIAFDREEDYRGAIAVAAESLPPGILAAAGADYEPDKDPPQSIGKRERYVARSERTVLVLTAAADAPPSSQPQIARIVVRPLAGGKLGDAVSIKSFPIMVVSKP